MILRSGVFVLLIVLLGFLLLYKDVSLSENGVLANRMAIKRMDRIDNTIKEYRIKLEEL